MSYIAVKVLVRIINISYVVESFVLVKENDSSIKWAAMMDYLQITPIQIGTIKRVHSVP
jgi:hypothetical protein